MIFIKAKKDQLTKKNPAITAIDRKFYLPARYAISFHIEKREYFLKIEDSHVRSYLTYLTQTKEQRIYNFGKRHHGHKTKRNENEN